MHLILTKDSQRHYLRDISRIEVRHHTEHIGKLVIFKGVGRPIAEATLSEYDNFIIVDEPHIDPQIQAFVPAPVVREDQSNVS